MSKTDSKSCGRGRLAVIAALAALAAAAVCVATRRKRRS